MHGIRGCLGYFQRWSVNAATRGHRRGVGKQCIILTGPRETVPPNATRELHRGSVNGGYSTKQVGAKREWRPMRSPFIGSQSGVHKKRHEGVSRGCMIVTVSQSGQEGELVVGTRLITLAPLVTWVGCSQPFCGDVKAVEKYEVLTSVTQGIGCLIYVTVSVAKKKKKKRAYPLLVHPS